MNPAATHLLIRNNEIALKGRNRGDFERRFLKNLSRTLGTRSKVETLSDRFLIPIPEELRSPPEKLEAMVKDLTTVSGVHSVAPCMVLDSYDLDRVKEAACTWSRFEFESQKPASFAIRTKRVNPAFPMPGIEVDAAVGTEVRKLLPSLKTDLNKPDFKLAIELRKRHALLWSNAIDGVHGLPQDSSQRVLCLLSGGIDSPVAAVEILRRGCAPVLVHFHSRPFTSEASVEKVRRLAEVIRKYSTGRVELWLVPLLDIQKVVRDSCSERFRTIHYRRFMMRIAEELAKRVQAKAIVTGEAIGQVASQTLTNIGAIEDAVKIPILRPLIAWDKDQIMAKAKAIGSFQISIEPHDDTCTLFAPEKPSTQAKLSSLQAEDNDFPVYKLVFDALDRAEKIKI